MAEESAVEENVVPDQTVPTSPISDPYETPDYFLQALVRLANNGIEIGVTLTVGGFLVSGIIVGGKRFFDEHLVSGMAKDMPESTRQSMTEFFNSFGKLYDPIPEDSGEGDFLTSFIHLRDARFFHHAGKPIPGNHAIWWRGRLSEIQGFSVGNLSHETT